MAGTVSSSPWILILTITAMLMTTQADSQENTKTYIVYMGNHPSGEVPKSELHISMLQKALGSNKADDALLHNFKRSINGFVVRLTEEEMPKIAAMESVVSVFLNGKKQLHTTRSWDFIGFPQQVNRAATESDIVIGVLDTGIWPESSSLDDSGFGPPPTKRKGACYNITCNNKIIGAKYYRSDKVFGEDDIISPIDSDGRGTHTASTAAGGLVSSASLYGLGLGTAKGGVPSARIAVYKVCWADGCHDADILAAFDDAIADGVDIISASLGDAKSNNYFNDSIAIGAFHAMRHGILTSNSVGNSGPNLKTISNFSPWSLSVAATTTDRTFFTEIQLGNNLVYEGVSINTFDLSSNLYPIVYGGDVPNIPKGYNSSISRLCLEDSLNQDLVKGKIVLCDGISGATKVGFASGAAGIVMHREEIRDTGSSYALPASHIYTQDAIGVAIYLTTTSEPNCNHIEEHKWQQYFCPLCGLLFLKGSKSSYT